MLCIFNSHTEQMSYGDFYSASFSGFPLPAGIPISCPNTEHSLNSTEGMLYVFVFYFCLSFADPIVSRVLAFNRKERKATALNSEV